MCIRRSLFRLLCVVVANIVMVVYVGNLSAGLIAYDGFDYPAGTDNLGGQNGGTGWAVANAWSGAVGSGPTEEVRAPGSTYSVLETEGNKAYVAGTDPVSGTGAVAGSFRNLPSTLGTGDETLWVSFIGQRDGTNLVRFFSLSFYQGGTASSNERFSIGENSLNATDTWGLHFTSSATGRQNVLGSSITSESFLLARIDYHSGANDDIYLWVNYDITQDRPGIGTADASSVGLFNLAFDRVAIRAGGKNADGPAAKGYYDEIRIGDTYRDVTVIPEPASLALVLLGMVGLGPRARRRRAATNSFGDRLSYCDHNHNYAR